MKTVQMHVFVNASLLAFAQVWFLCPKRKGAPIRAMTIPRLELQVGAIDRLEDSAALYWQHPQTL